MDVEPAENTESNEPIEAHEALETSEEHEAHELHDMHDMHEMHEEANVVVAKIVPDNEAEQQGRLFKHFFLTLNSYFAIYLLQHRQVILLRMEL